MKIQRLASLHRAGIEGSLGFLFLFAQPLAHAQQTTRAEASGPRCLASLGSGNEAYLSLPPGMADCSDTLTNPSSLYEPQNGIVYQIPVVWHVIHRTNNVGNLGSSRIESQMEVLNEDFNALLGSAGALGNNARIHFYIATVDENGNPKSGIRRYANDSWFTEQPTLSPSGAVSFSFLAATACDPNRFLNIYTKRLSAGGGANGCSDPLGYGLTPQGYPSLIGTEQDMVLMEYRQVGRSTPHQGRVVTHEVGHWLGLVHTFARFGYGPMGLSCPPAGANCYGTGDLICDTNPQIADSCGEPCDPMNPMPPISCGSPDPFENYMDYSEGPCKTEFTPEQVNRMRCTLENWRPLVHLEVCVSSSSRTYRSAPPNPDAYTATTAKLGTPQRSTVDTRPYLYAAVLARSQPTNTTLKGGQVLLIDLGSTNLGTSGLLFGPDVTYEWTLPFDPSYCGATLSTQAVLLGGRKPFALTNAIDFVVGS